jgi:hypothetical protein
MYGGCVGRKRLPPGPSRSVSAVCPARAPQRSPAAESACGNFDRTLARQGDLVVAAYVPDRGDLVWLQFDPQADQLKSLDWRARKVKRIGRLSDDALAETIGKLVALIEPSDEA